MTQRAQWLKHEERRQAETRRQQRMLELEHYLRQATVAMELLTRDPHWDGFLQVLQGHKEEAATKAQAIRERLQSSEYLHLEKLAALRHELALTQARIDALDEAIRIPGEVLRIGRS